MEPWVQSRFLATLLLASACATGASDPDNAKGNDSAAAAPTGVVQLDRSDAQGVLIADPSVPSCAVDRPLDATLGHLYASQGRIEIDSAFAGNVICAESGAVLLAESFAHGFGDWNGDGAEDALREDWYGGDDWYQPQLWIHAGPMGPQSDIGDAAVSLVAPGNRQGCYSGRFLNGDVDGDGLWDPTFVVANAGGDECILGAFPPTGAGLIDNPTFLVSGPISSGTTLELSGDLNGDGLAEVLVGTAAGRTIWRFDSPVVSGSALDDADAGWSGGATVAGQADMDGDGRDEVIATWGEARSAKVLVIPGVAPSGWVLDVATAGISVNASEGLTPWWDVAAGNTPTGGLLVARPAVGSNGRDSDPGAQYGFGAPLSGQRSADEADFVINVAPPLGLGTAAIGPEGDIYVLDQVSAEAEISLYRFAWPLP